MAEVRKRISGIRKALRIIAVIPVIIRAAEMAVRIIRTVSGIRKTN